MTKRWVVTDLGTSVVERLDWETETLPEFLSSDEMLVLQTIDDTSEALGAYDLEEELDLHGLRLYTILRNLEKKKFVVGGNYPRRPRRWFRSPR